MPDRAIDALQALARRDLSGWTGLPADTSLADVRAVFELDESWQGEAPLGSGRIRTPWLAAGAPGFDEGLSVWVDGPRVLMIDARYPVLPVSPQTLLDAFGPPAERLDSYLGPLPIAGAEQVFPERGITLYINPDNGKLLRVAVFSPVTLADYMSRLRLDLRTTRLPLTGRG